MRLTIFTFSLGLVVYFFLFFAESSEKVYDSGEEVCIQLINSTGAMQKVTFEYVLEDGTCSPIVYQQSVIPNQSYFLRVQVGTYAIKIQDLVSRDVKTISSFNIGKHLYVEDEMLYYLDLSLERNFVVAEIEHIDANQVSAPKFSLFKVYDGSRPFQLARKLKDEKRMFLIDSCVHKRSVTQGVYAIAPIARGLSRHTLEKYLSKQITMLCK